MLLHLCLWTLFTCFFRVVLEVDIDLSSYVSSASAASAVSAASVGTAVSGETSIRTPRTPRNSSYSTYAPSYLHLSSSSSARANATRFIKPTPYVATAIRSASLIVPLAITTTTDLTDTAGTAGTTTDSNRVGKSRLNKGRIGYHQMPEAEDKNDKERYRDEEVEEGGDRAKESKGRRQLIDKLFHEFTNAAAALSLSDKSPLMSAYVRR